MKVLIYGDIGGSGGYVRYCKGLFGSDSTPFDTNAWFVCSIAFFESIKPLDSRINVITHPWIDSKSPIKRYLWHLWVYPRIVNKVKPDIEFYPSGQIRKYLRKALTVATCHNLLLFDQKELDRIDELSEKKFFSIYRKNQIHSFKNSNAVIFLSNHSQKVVCGQLPEIKSSTVIAHGLDKIFLIPEKRSYKFKDRICLLYVSPFYQYKHQIEVVQAVQLLRETTGFDICIKLIGGGNSSAAIQLKEFVDEKKKSGFCYSERKYEI